jgi:hypothetical protein
MNSIRIVVAICFSLFLLGSLTGNIWGATEKESQANVSTSKDESATKSAPEEKETFKKDVARTMKEMNAKISLLDEKAKKEGSELKSEAKEAWHDVKAKQKIARAEAKKLNSATHEAWESTKAETHKALEELKASYEKAVSYFK